MQLPNFKQLAKVILCSFLFFAFLILPPSPLSAQGNSDLSIGQWQSHLPYQRAHYVAQSSTRIYASTEWSIFYVEKATPDVEVEFLSKVEGLSDVEMNLIKYDPFNDKLIAVYNNSNIDLIDDQSITNLPFILTSQGVGDKRVFDVFVENESTTYLAMGFGLKELNVKNGEFGDETKAEIRFNSVTVLNNMVYVSTDEGIYRFNRNTNNNIQDFSEWEWLGPQHGFPADYTSTQVTVFNNALYTDIDSVLYRYDGNNNLDSIFHEESLTLHYLSAEGKRLIAGYKCCIPSNSCDCSTGCAENCDSKILFFDTDDSYLVNGSKCANRTRYALEDESGRIWYADSYRALRMANGYEDDCGLTLLYNSPRSASATQMIFDEDNLWVATELHSIVPKKIGSGIFSYIDGNWTNFVECQKGALKNINGFLTLAVHPDNKNIYAGTVDDGIVELVLDEGESGSGAYKPSVRYNASNSNGTLTASGNNLRITGMDFDQENNLWVINHGSTKPLAVLKNDGIWTNDFINIPFTDLRFMVVDDLGYKWFSVDGVGSGLMVYDDNGTIDDSSDDRFRTISSANSEVPSNFIFSITKDLDGDIWVGTTEGIVIFECGANVFDASCRGSKRILEVDGFNGYLLESEEVTAIAVDGANRKWVGTGNGVFVLSPSGEEQLAFFDKSNSPIFDNQITGISINQNSGEVYIGTAKGLLSYRSDAVGGGRSNSSSALVYPNPVRPEYDGPIAIKGLARDSNIKITDVNGQLIYETTALGGQAIWDGKDYQGRKASSGVYLVFSTNSRNLDSPDAIVGKILFMR